MDGLRAVAVGLVIVYHAGLEIPGDLGVTGFFVLSGFLITWLLLAEHDRTGGVSLRSFYLRRTLRIFPAYYAFVLFSLASDRLLGDGWTPGQTWSIFGYGVNYYNAFNNHEGPIPHAWSLAVEEQFYLLWPAAFLLLVRRGERALRWGLAGLILAVLAWRSWLYLGAGAPAAYVYNAFDTRFDSLAVGCLLAALLRLPAVVRAAAPLGAQPWFVLGTLVLLAVSRSMLGEGWHYSAGFTADSLLIAVLVVQLLLVHRSTLWRWLDWRPVAYLGALSYPLYLWHMVGSAIGHRIPGIPPGLDPVAGVLASIALAAGSYHLLEQPILRLRPMLEARLVGRNATPAGSSAPSGIVVPSASVPG
ncbi:MAG TPA: acyltransferase [Longimicrobiaceae bacterium]|nr:acyltransferase [Longimicrobiaceae bacterium]